MSGEVEAAAETPGCLAAGRRQPLTERAELVAGEDGRHRPWDPAQLQSVREVCERPDPAQIECGSCLQDRLLDRRTLIPWPEELAPRVAGHRVPLGPDLMAGDGDRKDVRPRRLGQRSTGEPIGELQRVSPFDLIPVHGAPAGGVVGKDLVGLDGHIPTAGLGAEPHPVVAGRPTHQHHLLGGEAVEDPVAHEVAVGAAADEVSGATDTEGLEAVHGQARQEPLSVWAAQVGRRHVERLVVERNPVAPRQLLVTPRRELRSDELGRLAQHGVLEDRSLAVAVQVVDEVGNGVQEILERSGLCLGGHVVSSGCRRLGRRRAPAIGGHRLTTMPICTRTRQTTPSSERTRGAWPRKKKRSADVNTPRTRVSAW